MKSIGLMSGTSLDGLDICYVEFFEKTGRVGYKILKTKALRYSEEMVNSLHEAFNNEEIKGSPVDLEFGKYLGEKVNEFIYENSLQGQVDFIASHGHTIFHQPEKGITVQIGDGKKIADITGITVINDFRIKDVELGGQGAPLVPIGDRLLFGDFDACINLGGFSNISFDQNKVRIAFDISPCNLPFNKLSKEYFNSSYDDQGKYARSGNLIDELIEELDDLDYYKMKNPKSLGVEWLINKFYPILIKYEDYPAVDIMASVVEHIANQISSVLNQNNIAHVLLTGGGVFNTYLLDRIQSKTNAQITIPNNELVEFKEAMIFAFLGFLNLKKCINTLKSVTGASRDSIGGILHRPD